MVDPTYNGDFTFKLRRFRFYRGSLPEGVTLSLLQGIFAYGSGKVSNDLLAGIEEGKPEPAVYQLLPLLAANPVISDTIPDRLQGILRKTWYNNQLLIASHARLQTVFRDAGIRILTLGGIASALSLYPKQYTRPIHELTVMVEFRQAQAAAALLREKAWTPRFAIPGTDPQFLPGCSFINSEKHFQLNLRWHMLIRCCYPGADDEFWNRACPLECGDFSTLTLDPADLLLYLSSELHIADEARSALRVADALTLVQSSEHMVDWDRLLTQARDRHLSLPLSALLGYLLEYFEVDVPTRFLQSLARTPLPVLEIWEASYGRRPPDQRLMGQLPVHYFDYRRFRHHRSALEKPSSFSTYLIKYWQVGSRWGLTKLLLRLAARRLQSVWSLRDPARIEKAPG